MSPLSDARGKGGWSAYKNETENVIAICPPARYTVLTETLPEKGCQPFLSQSIFCGIKENGRREKQG